MPGEASLTPPRPAGISKPKSRDRYNSLVMLTREYTSYAMKMRVSLVADGKQLAVGIADLSKPGDFGATCERVFNEARKEYGDLDRSQLQLHRENSN